MVGVDAGVSRCVGALDVREVAFPTSKRLTDRPTCVEGVSRRNNEILISNFLGFKIQPGGRREEIEKWAGKC